MTLSLRTRLLLTVAPLVALIAAVGGAGVWLLHNLGQRSDEILRENYVSVRAMDRLNEAVERIDSSFQFALAGREEDARAAYVANWPVVREQLTVERGNVTIFPDEQVLVAELERLAEAYRTSGDEFFDRPSGDEGRRDDYFGRAEKAGLLHNFREVKRVAAAVHDLNEREMRRASTDAQATARRSVVGFAIGLVVAVTLAGLSVWWLVRTLLGPIRTVTAAATAIGAGDLQQLVPVLTGDEVGKLAEAFNGMAAKLRSYRQTGEYQLDRARRAAQATVDAFTDPVVVIDPSGRVEVANPAAGRLFGTGPSGTTWVPPESLRAVILEATASGRAVLAEGFDRAVSFHHGGEDRSYLPQVRPVFAADGEPLGVAVVLHDITRFRLLDQLKSDWVATVSHELKTPLSGVQLAVHVLLDEVIGPLTPKQIELLVEARENAERLRQLIQQLLALAKLEDDRRAFDRKPVDPAALIRSVADAVAARADDKQISLTVGVAPDLPAMSVDTERFSHALGNLLNNAVTYTDPGGTVNVTARRGNDNTVSLVVADTGIGIPQADLPHVFERFFRVSGRDGTAGTGLGLAIVREVVEGHGGSIRCESTEGKGTTFTITLPVVWEGP